MCNHARERARGVDHAGTLGLRIQHPFLSAPLVSRNKAQGLLYASPEILGGKPRRPFLSDCRERCRP
jgi:hypothetical protein